MNRWLTDLLYPTSGMFAIALVGSIQGVDGCVEAVAAWCVCGLALVADTIGSMVAERRSGPKISPTRGLIVIPKGMAFRMGLVLCGAVLLYQLARDRLGIGYWLTVVALYQVAVAVIALRHGARSAKPD